MRQQSQSGRKARAAALEGRRRGISRDADGDNTATALAAAPARPGLKRVNAIKIIPSRLASRIYGAVNSVPLPVAARSAVYSAWGWLFKARMHEVPQPLASYPSLQAFFTRTLVAGARPVDAAAALVSPVDGAVVSLSSDLTREGVLRQVKGLDFRPDEFLGMAAPPAVAADNVLHSVVLYLSPGDYHRFHSPCAWTVHSRTHIAGQLLPVNPLVARALGPALLCTNERVALCGTWAHGFFSYTAVGATNVGSVRLGGALAAAGDADLRTNVARDDWHCGFSVGSALGWRAHQAPGPQQQHSWLPASSLAAAGFAAAAWAGTSVARGMWAAAAAALVTRPLGALTATGRYWWRQHDAVAEPAGAPVAGTGGVAAAVRRPHKMALLPSVAGSMAVLAALLRPAAPVCRTRKYLTPVPLQPGEEVGWFELGSTVVLVFEAPRDFAFDLAPGRKVFMGQPITPWLAPAASTSADAGSQEGLEDLDDDFSSCVSEEEYEDRTRSVI